MTTNIKYSSIVGVLECFLAVPVYFIQPDLTRQETGREGEETNIVTQGVNGLNLNPTTLFGLRLNYQIISGEIFHYLVNSLKYSVVFDKIF